MKQKHIFVCIMELFYDKDVYLISLGINIFSYVINYRNWYTILDTFNNQITLNILLLQNTYLK